MSDYETPLPRDLVARAMALRSEGEPPSFDELVGEDMPVDQVAELWLSAQEYQRAAKNVLDAIALHLGNMLEASGKPVEVMDMLVVYKTKKSSRIADEGGFWNWMKENPEYMTAFNPNTIRKTKVPPSVLDTFYEVVETPQPVVTSIPVHVIERNKARKEARGE